MKANRKIEEKISYHDCALQKVKQLDQFENHEYQLSQSLKYKHKDLSSIPRADVKEKRMVFNVCMKGHPMLPDVPSSLTVAPFYPCDKHNKNPITLNNITCVAGSLTFSCL